MDKILQWALVAVIVFGSGYLVYSFVAPAPEAVEVEEVFDDSGASESWVKYSNEELGFSFEYPERWGEVALSESDATKDCPDPCGKLFRLSFENNKNFSLGGATVDFTAGRGGDQHYYQKGYFLEDGQIKLVRNYGSPPFSVDAPGAEIVSNPSGVEGVRSQTVFNDDFLPWQKQDNILINLENNTYPAVDIALVFFEGDDEAELRGLLERLFDTLKLTDSTDAVSWVEYTNESLGFKYSRPDVLSDKVAVDTNVSSVTLDDFLKVNRGGACLVADGGSKTFLTGDWVSGECAGDVGPKQPLHQLETVDVYLFREGDAGFSESNYYFIVGDKVVGLSFSFDVFDENQNLLLESEESNGLRALFSEIAGTIELIQ